MNDYDYIIVQTTCDNEDEAKKIAKVLLEQRLAACIQIKEIDSFYMWNDELCEDTETLVSIKTKKSNFKKNHSYDLPEIIEIPITNGTKEYLKWIDKSC